MGAPVSPDSRSCPRCSTALVADARYCHACGIGIAAAASGEFAPFDLERFFDYALDMLCIAGVDGYFKRVNLAFERILGFTPEEMLANPFVEFIHPEDRSETTAEVGKLASGAPTLSFENRYLCKDGSYKDLSWTSYPEPGTGLLYAVARDISDAKRRNDLVDGLTGLASRRAFDEALEKEWKRAVRLRVPFAAAFFDIDRFRKYNEHMGHKAGDDCLRQLSQVLRRHSRRAGDIVARSDGGEFGFLMEGGLTPEKAIALCEIIRAGIEALDLPHPGADSPGCVTVSVGVAAGVPGSAETPERIVRLAREALTDAKQQGRNCVVCAAS
ncbi:MAG: diguanylate cyclase [Gemmatimonadales bacterium]|nr:MAG: diguanylate cyclase [Gemmatimonadales bacterium]